MYTETVPTRSAGAVLAIARFGRRSDARTDIGQ
jgi:hypothetical protein